MRGPFDFDSPIIGNHTPAPRPSGLHPFLSGSIGSHVAAMWATSNVDSGILKALLLLFDKIAVVGGSGVGLASSRDWVALEDLGLVAHLSPFDMLTAVTDESILALHNALTTAKWNSSSGSAQWDPIADMLIRDVLIPFFHSTDRRDLLRGIRHRFAPCSEEALVTIVPQLAMQSLALMGVRISPLSLDLNHAISLTKLIPEIFIGQRATVLDVEGIVPSLAGTALQDVLQFREEARPAFEKHMNDMMAYMNRVNPSTGPRADDLDPIVMSAAVLRRMGRTRGLAGRGYVGFGLVGSPTCHPLSSAAELDTALLSDCATLLEVERPMYMYAITPAEPIAR